MPKDWLIVRVKNQAGEDITEMVISGVIGSSWYDSSGATSKEFREKLATIGRGKKVLVRINSEGGSVQDALEIYNLIQARKEDITTRNDGYALSSASVILCAGGRSITPHSSITMIHEPWSMTMGDEGDHLKAAEMLAKHGDTIAGIYARKTGKTAAEMRELMRKESWFTGAEACQNRLADAMAEDAACPDCGHEECSECEVEEGGVITCSECGETNPATEWEESVEEEMAEDRRKSFAALNISPFNHIPNHIYAMLRPGVEHQQVSNTPKVLNTAGCQTPKGTKVSNTESGVEHQPGVKHQKRSNHKMNKTAILALLKTHGVEIADDASDEVILAALAKLGERPAAANAGDAQTIATLQAQLTAEKKVRITAEVKRRGENKIKNDKLNWWIELAMRDEATTFDQIDSLPTDMPGGQPLTGTVTVVENRLEEIRKERVASKRYALLRAEYDGIMQDALLRDSRMGLAMPMQTTRGGGGQRLYPVGANSYSSSLVTQFLLDGAVTKLQNRWAPLKIFSKDYSQDRYKPRATGQLKFVTAGGTTQKNATNFESGDATVTNVQIAVDQYTTAMHVTNDELNSGLRMENLIEIKTAECADNILKVAFSPLSKEAIVTNAAIIRSATTFNFSDMATASGELKKSLIKYAVLDGEYMARIENNPVFFQATGTMNGSPDGWQRFGWDGVFTNSNWTGTHAGANDENIRGLFCNPQVMGAIAGLPLVPPSIPGNTLMESTITVPEVDISIAAYSWFSLSTRTFWMSYDLMFGSQLLDESAGVLLLSS